MEDFEEKLNKTFEIKKQAQDLVVKSHEVHPIATTQAETEQIKDQLIDTISDAKDAFTELVQIAKETTSEKHFQALAALLKSLTDATKAIGEIDLTRAQTNKLNSEMIDRMPNKLQQNNQTNVFVGSTKDAIDMLKTLDKDKNE